MDRQRHTCRLVIDRDDAGRPLRIWVEIGEEWRFVLEHDTSTAIPWWPGLVITHPLAELLERAEQLAGTTITTSGRNGNPDRQMQIRKTPDGLRATVIVAGEWVMELRRIQGAAQELVPSTSPEHLAELAEKLAAGEVQEVDSRELPAVWTGQLTSYPLDVPYILIASSAQGKDSLVYERIPDAGGAPS